VTAGSGDGEVQREVRGAVGLVTLDRPQVRNALNGSLLEGLREALAEVDADVAVRVIVLTGSDPAFCAGLDLRALGAEDPALVAEIGVASHPPWPPTRKPVIGAVNGPAVTGGLELALACDLLVASERATFADTHGRVGVMPGWEMTSRLPAAVGRRTATWMSLSGTPLSATQAAAAGLVLRVVPHEQLLDAAFEVAEAVAASDPAAVEVLLDVYRRTESTLWAEGIDLETAAAERWRAGGRDYTSVEQRRASVIAAGRQQHGQTRG